MSIMQTNTQGHRYRGRVRVIGPDHSTYSSLLFPWIWCSWGIVGCIAYPVRKTSLSPHPPPPYKVSR